MTEIQTKHGETAVAETDAATLANWRTVAACLGGMVADRVKSLVEPGEGEAADVEKADIGEISVLVLTARRVMELQDRYEQKVQSGVHPGDNDIAGRFDALARAVGLRITPIDDGCEGAGEGVRK